MQGEHFQLDKEPLMQIPIAVSSQETQNLIANLVDVIRLLKQAHSQLDSHVSNDYLAKEFEKMINGCVYEIYFEDEIKKYYGKSIATCIRNYIPATFTPQNVYKIYSDIESTGIIEIIDSLAFSNSEILRTISLS